MEIGSKVRQIHHMQSKDGNAYSLINAGKVRRALEHAPHTGEPEFVFGRSGQNRNYVHESRTTFLSRFPDLLFTWPSKSMLHNVTHEAAKF